MLAKEFNIHGHTITSEKSLCSSITKNEYYIKTIFVLEYFEERLSSFKTKYPMNLDDKKVCNRVTNQFLKELGVYKNKFLQATIELDPLTFVDYTFLFLEDLHILFLTYNEKYLFKFSFYDLYFFHYKHLHGDIGNVQTYVMPMDVYNFLHLKYFGGDHE